MHFERPRIAALAAASAGVRGAGAALFCEQGDGEARRSDVNEFDRGNTVDGDTAQIFEDNSSGGLAVLAAGPAAMICELKNAVARLAMMHAHHLGRVACHTELYSL